MYVNLTLYCFLTFGTCAIGLLYLVCVSVCLSVYLSVIALAATYLVCMFRVRRDRVPCRLLMKCKKGGGGEEGMYNIICRVNFKRC